MSDFSWNDPRYNAGAFFKFTAEGDTVEGVIVGITETTFPARDDQAEQTFPVLLLDTAQGEREVTISGVDLLAKTKAKNPQIGDWYSAAWVATAGKKRIYLVNVKKVTNEGAHVPATVDQRHAGLVAAQQAEVPF